MTRAVAVVLRKACRPEVCLVRVPEVVLRGAFDRVVLARPVLEGEADGERLLVERLRWSVEGVRLAFMPVKDGKTVKNRLHLDLTCGRIRRVGHRGRG
jgi:hypothetical protein